MKLLASLWLLLVALLVLLAVSIGPKFDSSIMSLLPESQQQPIVRHAVERMSDRFSKRLVIVLSGADDETVREAISNLASRLTAVAEVSHVDWSVKADEIKQYQREQYPYRFSVLDESSRALLLAGAYQQLEGRALSQIFSPLSAGKIELIDDPFGFSLEFNKRQTSELNIEVANTLLKISNTDLPAYMLVATLAEQPFSPQIQDAILGVIAEENIQLNKLGIKLSMSGMILHAQAGTKQATHEISTIGLGSIVGIIFIMLMVFQRFKPLFLVLFPVIVGCLTAVAVTLLIFDRVHLITLAFGVGLVGVSIDYALHFLCERQVTPSKSVINKILPGLLLGLFSSVMAYAAQAFAPFPGLQQMAVFSVVGLVSSWLTVVLCLPLLTKNDALNELVAAKKLSDIRHYFPRVDKSPILVILLISLTVLSFYTVQGSDAVDDIRLLQTSPAYLLKQEKELQEMLGVSSSSQFLLLKCQRLESCLQQEELLAPSLDNLKKAGAFGSYQALSQQLPSVKRQAENAALLQKLYENKLSTLYDKIKLPNDKEIMAFSAFKQKQTHYLKPEIWMEQQASKRGGELLVTLDEEQLATIIRFTGLKGEQSKQALITLSQQYDDVEYIDQVQNISDLMGQYRDKVLDLITLAYLCVFLVLAFRYKSQVWRVVLPPLLASVFTLALLVNVEQGINLFHLMALILVLGIGLDMGIFLMETEGSSNTWLAVSLSTYTSLLAFGLLTLSKTPVLHHFGLTVLLGLTFVWLLAPTMRQNTKGAQKT